MPNIKSGKYKIIINLNLPKLIDLFFSPGPTIPELDLFDLFLLYDFPFARSSTVFHLIGKTLLNSADESKTEIFR